MIQSRVAEFITRFAAPANLVFLCGAAGFGLLALAAAKLGAGATILLPLISLLLAWSAGALSALLLIRIICFRSVINPRTEAILVACGGVMGLAATTTIFVVMPMVEALDLLRAGGNAALNSMQWMIGIGTLLTLSMTLLLSRRG
jgi:hypothetical protein